MELLKKVTVEINKGLVYRKIKAKQNDTARYLLFTIVDNGVPFSLEGKEVKIFAIKPDGKLVFNACQINNSTNGEVKLNLTSQMLAVPGTLKAELVINEGAEILSTIPFEIEVIKSLRNDRAIESTNEFTILFSKIEEGKSLEVSLSELIEEGLPLYNKLNVVVEVGKELNSSLPPKTSEANVVLNELLQAIESGGLNNFITKRAIRLYSVDLNKITIGGLYAVVANGSTNLPEDSDGYLLVMPWDDEEWCAHIFIEDITGRMYTRTNVVNGNDITWSSWAKNYTNINKPTPEEIGAQPKEATIFTDNGDYIGVRTEGRTENQYFEFWDPVAGWADAKFKEVYAGNGQYKVYHPGNKPTPSDIGALSTKGGTLTGYTKFETDYIDIGVGDERLIRIGVGPTDMYICNLKTNKYLQLKDTGILSYSNKEICDKGHFVANIGLNGYQMLPSGLCLQWGYVSMGNSATKVINFPKSFKNSDYAFLPGVYGGPNRLPGIKVYSAKNGNISIQSESGFNAYWFAIGEV